MARVILARWAVGVTLVKSLALGALDARIVVTGLGVPKGLGFLTQREDICSLRGTAPCRELRAPIRGRRSEKL